MTSNSLSRDLLVWYDRHRRHLPWRAAPGDRADPYHVWLSEIMLQQTTVVTVGPYFQRFLEAWPTVEALAAAPLDRVLTLWQGLGYYARARNLHRCAQVVTRDYNGRFPDRESALLTLPGVGPYTAAAIAAIAYDHPAVVVDGNVERVIARLYALDDPLPGVKPQIREQAARLTPRQRPGDHAQAMMDLGATVCTPKSPKCGTCPLALACLARQRGLAAELPRRTPRKPRPTRHGVVFWLQREDGAVLLQQRPPRGLLGGMMGLPGSDWRESPWTDDAARAEAPAVVNWQPIPGTVIHVFTHFRLNLTVWRGTCTEGDATSSGIWVTPQAFADYPLPTVMHKAIALVRAAS
ncbi:A/G-specific adenine glycosylase [Magnetospira thiophila]